MANERQLTDEEQKSLKELIINLEKFIAQKDEKYKKDKKDQKISTNTIPTIIATLEKIHSYRELCAINTTTLMKTAHSLRSTNQDEAGIIFQIITKLKPLQGEHAKKSPSPITPPKKEEQKKEEEPVNKKDFDLF